MARKGVRSKAGWRQIGRGQWVSTKPQRRTARRAFRAGYDRTVGYYGAAQKELKFHDVDLDDATVATGGTVTASVNLIPQGVTEVQRIGRKCTIRSIGWRYQMTIPERDAAAQPGQGDVLRMIMYQDKQTNGATAAVTDILEAADYQSFNNLVNKGRFRTLLDKTLTLNYSGLASDGAGVVSQALMFKSGTFFKSCNIPIEFDSTTGAITEIRSNNIGVLLLSGSGVAGFSSKIRLRFEG